MSETVWLVILVWAVVSVLFGVGLGRMLRRRDQATGRAYRRCLRAGKVGRDHPPGVPTGRRRR